MTMNSRLTARHIMDAIVFSEGTLSPSNTLKKAGKVLEDRRERNPITSIMLLSDQWQPPSVPDSSLEVHLRTVFVPLLSSSPV
ncbi:putative E3 ubiquitin-protein ligase WAVH2 [Camellia lanceoleosa]|uniref:E3 ubiquitin-protein ligase WAVH2 n=1 Tax=Camellia lanceoleosa TaxID=1840588 RepID=A0ACC0GNA5_9ERIC|nr:putative E3 ubiquitin-protein ligase WAVH2 [Camellia lanceoleosa]